MSWTNWYHRPNYWDIWEQKCAEAILNYRIKEEKQIIEETLERRSMTPEQAQLISPDIDELEELGFKPYIESNIPNIPKLEDELEAIKLAKYKGRSQNRTRLPIPKKIKALLVKTRGGICEHCKEEVYQHIHHIDGNPINNDPGNLMLVCYECHKQLERIKKKVKVY